MENSEQLMTGFGLAHGLAFQQFLPTISLTSGGASSLAAGYYYIDNSTNANTIPVSGPWLSSISQVSSSLSRFNDVGLNDHTTFHNNAVSGTTVYVKGLYVFPANVTIESWTASLFFEVCALTIYYSTNGSTWTSWGSGEALPTFLTHTWYDHTADPANVTARYVQIILGDTATLDLPSTGRIGDWRITSS